MGIKLTEKNTEKMIESFIRAGLKKRNKRIKPGDNFYSQSIGERTEPIFSKYKK